MSTKTNTNISGGLSGMLSAFGNQLEDSMTNALLGLCDDLGIERDAFNTAWNSKYTETTGITLGSVEAKKDVQKPALTIKSQGGKKVPNAYQLYIKAWREAREQDNDDREFKQVRSDWAALSPEEKKEWAANTPDADEKPTQETEPVSKSQSESDSEDEDNDIPSIDGKALIASNWKVSELKEELKSRGLPVSGVKKVLIERLIEAETGNSDGEESDDDSSDSSDSESDSDSDSEDEDEDKDEDKDSKAIQEVLTQITDEIADIDATIKKDDDDLEEED